MPVISAPYRMLYERPHRLLCHPTPASPGLLSGQAPWAVTLHLQARCHAEGSGTRGGEGRRQQLTCEAGCEEIPTGHVFDGHTRLTLQEAGHKLRLELVSGSGEGRASCSTHWGSLVERSSVICSGVGDLRGAPSQSVTHTLDWTVVLKDAAPGLMQ